MKLRVFDEKTLPKIVGGKTAPARISLGKAGTISFNAKACELMDLKPDEKVSISQDEEVPENWYIHKSEFGFKVRDGYDKKGALFNHSKLVSAFVEAFGIDADKTHNFLIGGVPTVVNKVKYWGIITISK